MKINFFSASGGRRLPDQGLCPWTPLGAPPPDPRHPTIQKKLPPLVLRVNLPHDIVQRRTTVQHRSMRISFDVRWRRPM